MKLKDCKSGAPGSLRSILRSWRKIRTCEATDRTRTQKQTSDAHPPAEVKAHPLDQDAADEETAPASELPYALPPARKGSDVSIISALSSVWDIRPVSSDTARTSASAYSSDPSPELHAPSRAEEPVKKSKHVPFIFPTKPPLPPKPPPPLSPAELDDFCTQLVKEPFFIEALRTSRPYLKDPGRPSKGEDTLELFYPPLFAAAAICDPKINGLPVKQKSWNFQVPHRGLKVGECEFLNLTHSLADDFSISMLLGKDERPAFFLEYKLDLRAPRAKRIKYVLATQMEFTTAIRNLAAHILYSRPGIARRPADGGMVNSESERASINDALGKAMNKKRRRPKVYLSPAPHSFALLAQDMSSLESLTQPDAPKSSTPSPSPLAAILSTKGARYAFTTLHDILLDLRYLHRDSLVLRPERHFRHWEIAWTSSSLQASAADLTQCLSNSDPQSLLRLGEKLSRNDRCTESVRWGPGAKASRLYCLPMDAPRAAARNEREKWWVCWLVDAHVPSFW